MNHLGHTGNPTAKLGLWKRFPRLNLSMIHKICFIELRKIILYVHYMEPLTFQNLLKYCDHMIQFTVSQSYTDHIIWSIWYDLTQGKPLMRGFSNVNSSNISFVCNRLTLRDLTMRLKSNLRQQWISQIVDSARVYLKMSPVNYESNFVC